MARDPLITNPDQRGESVGELVGAATILISAEAPLTTGSRPIPPDDARASFRRTQPPAAVSELRNISARSDPGSPHGAHNVER